MTEVPASEKRDKPMPSTCLPPISDSLVNLDVDLPHLEEQVDVDESTLLATDDHM